MEDQLQTEEDRIASLREKYAESIAEKARQRQEEFLNAKPIHQRPPPDQGPISRRGWYKKSLTA